MSSQYGSIYRISTFGESHGAGVGVVIDGCPAGIVLDVNRIEKELARRRPGQSSLSSPRRESDKLEIFSGLYKGRTLGTPLAIFVANRDARSTDYDDWARVYRPSHADYTYHIKYGHRTPHGGGRASARETIGRVIAGAVAAQILSEELGVATVAWVESISSINSHCLRNPPLSSEAVDLSPVRCPDLQKAEKMIGLIGKARKEGDSLGGTIGVAVHGLPPGLGDPVFDKLDAELAKSCLSIPACKGFESGSGFKGARMSGRLHNDIFLPKRDCEEESEPRERIENAYEQRESKQRENEQRENSSKASPGQIPELRTKTNFSGGIQGGISNGMPIILRLAFKPTATIHSYQASVDEDGRPQQLRPGGRHDPCVLPRAVPIVEAMVNLVLMDFYLMQRSLNPHWWLRFAKQSAWQSARWPAADLFQQNEDTAAD